MLVQDRAEADLIARRAATPAGMGALIDDLRSDLDDVAASLDAVRVRAQGEFSTARQPAGGRRGRGHPRTCSAGSRRRCSAALSLHVDGRLRALVAAGSCATLQRILFSLVINACGERRRKLAPRRSDARLPPAELDNIVVSVVDDRPTTPEQLTQAPGDAPRPKPQRIRLRSRRMALARQERSPAKGETADGGAAISISPLRRRDAAPRVTDVVPKAAPDRILRRKGCSASAFH